jgi:DinB superfamily
MQYIKLDATRRQEFMDSLAQMKTFLFETFESLTAEEARTPGPGGSFSPVEQVWHLADLEREGFGVRIRRLKDETNPHLPDFDGDSIARERHYRSLSISDGLEAFAAARAANLFTLRTLLVETWLRNGTQEGVGPVSLCDMPVFIHQHDCAHVAEILAWKEFIALARNVEQR